MVWKQHNRSRLRLEKRIKGSWYNPSRRESDASGRGATTRMTIPRGEQSSPADVPGLSVYSFVHSFRESSRPIRFNRSALRNELTLAMFKVCRRELVQRGCECCPTFQCNREIPTLSVRAPVEQRTGVPASQTALIKLHIAMYIHQAPLLRFSTQEPILSDVVTDCLKCCQFDIIFRYCSPNY